MAKRIVILIDGAFLRARTVKAGKKYDPTFIEAFALGCKTGDEEILRVLYYDCAPYIGTVKLPVSGEPFVCARSDKWLEELACKDLFAVRLGVLKFRGYKPKPSRSPSRPRSPTGTSILISNKKVSTSRSASISPAIASIAMLIASCWYPTIPTAFRPSSTVENLECR